MNDSLSGVRISLSDLRSMKSNTVFFLSRKIDQVFAMIDLLLDTMVPEMNKK